MVQIALPTSTVSNSWTIVGGIQAHLVIDEGVSSHNGDTDKLHTNGDNNSDGHLGDPTDPGVSTGHIIRAVARYSNAMLGQARDVDVQLRQGASTLIATLAISSGSLTTSYQTFSYTLSGAEADSITDYSDLRYRLDAGTGISNKNVHVTAIELEVPDPGGGYAHLIDPYRRLTLATIRRL